MTNLNYEDKILTSCSRIGITRAQVMKIGNETRIFPGCYDVLKNIVELNYHRDE